MSRRAITYGVVALVALGLLGLLLIPKGTTPWPPSGSVTNAQLRELVARGALLVDVRTAGEFGAGHISGANNVPVAEVQTIAKALDKAAGVIVYCETGARSNIAAQYLRAQGFQHVYDLSAGIAKWDGATTKGNEAGAAASPGGGPATALPTMYDFSSDT